MSEVLRQFIRESIYDKRFIDHLKLGIAYARGNRDAEADQIASDWITEVEGDMDNLLHPGHVTRIERFVAAQWPFLIEQFRGNQRLALLAMNNLLDAEFNDLVVGGSW